MLPRDAFGSKCEPLRLLHRSMIYRAMWRRIVPAALSLAVSALRAMAAERGAEHASYSVFAAGLHVADVEAGFDLGATSYQMRLAYHTTGLIRFFYHGHQFNTVQGTWDGDSPEPEEFLGDGVWHGVHRITRIDYAHGQPKVRELIPPNEAERQPIPPDLRANTIDTLSALAELLRRVADTGHCETKVHTYDGRRVTEVSAHTVETDLIPPDGQSAYSGRALRCDFEGRMLAGFLLGSSVAAGDRPLHGTAWLARVIPHMPPLPVRMTFQTRWFGNATMFLIHAAPGPIAVRQEN
jgi:hypothetical protein